VENWGAALYGDPCAECGYEWSLPRAKAVDLVAAIADRYAELLAGTDGRARHPDLEWYAGAYVCHVADNLRIWAERLAGAALGDATAVGLRRCPARASAGLQPGPDYWRAIAGRGEQRVDDIVSNNAHDAFHHAWDIQRSLGRDRP
jgi:hypothetical protein